jgi:hypothetical protein
MFSLQANLASALALFSYITAAAPAQGYGISQRQNTLSVGKAIYFLTNDAENAVVALPIGPDGMLSNGTVTATGGAGSNAIHSGTQEAIIPDALISQAALTVVGNVS